MNDREYIKFNTSIQTGSNAENLIRDSEGNIKAAIELRLPDNLFGGKSSNRKVESVAMQTSKFRLSMENTPIAQLPLDETLTTPSEIISKCQLDVYPFALLDDNQLKPTPEQVGTTLSFPNYKQHHIRYEVCLADVTNPSNPSYQTLESYDDCYANTENFMFPKTSRYYNIVEKSGSLGYKGGNHLMNLCVQTNHGNYTVEDNKLYINSIGTIEQMLQDAIENAITFACTRDSCVVKIVLIDVNDITESLSPKPDTTNVISIPSLNIEEACYWKTEIEPIPDSLVCDLLNACKPRVHIDGESLTISYDTAAFNDIVPIIWNTSYVDTYEQPEQMTLDEYRNSVWSQPPPKRKYKYGVVLNEDNTYSYSLLDNLKCLVMNIIGNKSMRDTFSFLPWIPVDITKINVPTETRTLTVYSIDLYRDVTKKQHKTDVVTANTGVYNGIIQQWSGIDSTFVDNMYNPDIDFSTILTPGVKYLVYAYRYPVAVGDTAESRDNKYIYLGTHGQTTTPYPIAAGEISETESGEWINEQLPPQEQLSHTTTTAASTPGTTTVETVTDRDTILEPTVETQVRSFAWFDMNNSGTWTLGDDQGITQHAAMDWADYPENPSYTYTPSSTPTI